MLVFLFSLSLSLLLSDIFPICAYDVSGIVGGMSGVGKHGGEVSMGEFREGVQNSFCPITMSIQ